MPIYPGIFRFLYPGVFCIDDPWWCHSKFFLSRNVSMTKISIEGARMGLGQDGLNVGWHNHNLRKINDFCFSTTSSFSVFVRLPLFWDTFFKHFFGHFFRAVQMKVFSVSTTSSVNWPVPLPLGLLSSVGKPMQCHNCNPMYQCTRNAMQCKSIQCKLQTNAQKCTSVKLVWCAKNILS